LYVEPFGREYGESENSVNSPDFFKSEMNSRAIDQVFREIRENLNIFNPSYLSCKGLLYRV
jgi:hypothetical protein